MTEFFQGYFGLALAGSAVMLAMLLLRPFLKKLPKRMMCLLWVAVLFRLLCPYTVEGPIPALWRPAQDAVTEGTGNNNAAMLPNADGLNADVWNFAGQAEYPYENPVSGMNIPASGHEPSVGQVVLPGSPVVNEQEEGGLPGSIQDASIGKEDAVQLPDEQSAGGIHDGNQQELNPDLEAGTGAVFQNQTENSSESVLSDEISEQVGMAESLDISEGMVKEGPDLKDLFIYVGGFAWLTGMAAAAVLLLWRYIYLQLRLKEAFPYKEWQGYPVKTSDVAGLPLVSGIFRPCIYVPLCFAETEQPGEELILTHELVHIQRKDILLKLLFCVAFCIHWWNPLMWISMYFMQQDVEMACDESVLAGLSEENRSLYARTLLQYAAKQSGLVLPLAFGESNTEKRVKNILNYKKLPFWGIVAGVILVVGIGVCIATRPHDVESGTSQEQTAEGSGSEGTGSGNPGLEEAGVPEGYSTLLNYMADLQTVAKEHWNQVYKEGNILSEDGSLRFYSSRVPAYIEDRVENGIVRWCHFENYGYAVTGDWQLIQYVTTIPYVMKDGKIYAGASQDRIIQKISGAGQAAELLLPYDTWYNTDPDIDYYHWDTVMEVLAERMKQNAPEKYEILKDPVKAVQLLLNLQGGSGELYGTSVLWSFDDSGSNRILFTMMQTEDDAWFPVECRTDGEELEYYEKDIDTMLSRIQDRQEFLKGITLQKLKEAGPVDNARISEIYTGELDVRELLTLDEIPEKDISLYGNAGGDLMVLRVREQIYFLDTWWQSMHGVLPQVFCGDYDGDGQEEYAVKTHVKTGTGYSLDDLYLVESPVYNAAGEEIRPYKVYQYDERKWMRDMDRITWEYHEKYQELLVSADGKSCSVSLKNLMENLGNEDEFEELSWGDIGSFEYSGEQWYLGVSAGIRTSSTGVQPRYEAGVEFLCPVEYLGDGSFSLGEIWMEAKYYGETPRVEYDASHREVIINRLRDHVDVNGDGYGDIIVLSVDTVEGDTHSWQELLDGYAVCHVRVYDGSWNVYDEEKYAATGGYNINAALWEQELSKAHAGNGMIALCEKNGSYYLLRSNASCYQGIYSYAYTVYGFMQASGRCYQADYRSLDNIEPGRTVASDLSDLPMEDMVNYTMALDGWLQNSIFLAYAGVDDGWRVRAYGGETYEATEIWKSLGVEKRVKQWMEQLCGLPKKEQQPGQQKFVQENPWIKDYLPKITALMEAQPTPYGEGDKRQYFLYRLANKRYLVSVREACLQGVYEYHYTVYNLNAAPEENETVDAGVVYVSATVPEDSFPVQDMVSYTEKLAGWLRDSILLATAAGSESSQQQLVTWTDGTQSFEAWESWKSLVQDVNQRIFDMQTRSDSAGKVQFPEEKPLTGMDNLSAALQNLNARYAVWGTYMLDQKN